MLNTFFKFFISYIFKAKTRQRLIIMAMGGLMLSSFSLLVIQSTLKGLQGKRVERSKQVKGHYLLKVKNNHKETIELLKEYKISNYTREYLFEGLIKNKSYIAAVIFHGIDSRDYIPDFLPTHIGRFSLYGSSYFSSRFNGDYLDEVELISPTHTDIFFGDKPRSKIMTLEVGIDTKEPELDEFHAWGDIRVAQSIVRERTFNVIRVYSELSDSQISAFKKLEVEVVSWEKSNSNLVYALSLENNLMIFLFMATVLLVILMIGGGLSIFYNRIKNDFASFWIMGLPLSKIKYLGAVNITLLTIISLVIGNLFGSGFLLILKRYSPVIMPSMFVERTLPISFELQSYFFSFFIPLLITFVFTIYFNLRFFKSKADFMQLIRSVGR